MTDYTNSFSAGDIGANKNISLLSYLSLLFIIPLFLRQNSPYVRFNVNQGLVLFIVTILMNLVQKLIGFIFSPLTIFLTIINTVFAFLWILIFVCIVLGVLNTINGRAKELPIIGKIRIIR